MDDTDRARVPLAVCLTQPFECRRGNQFEAVGERDEVVSAVSVVGGPDTRLVVGSL